MSTADLAPLNKYPDLSGDALRTRLFQDELEALIPTVDLPESDGQNMDSDWHRLNIELLFASIRFHFRNRDDYYAAGNSFIYFSMKQVRNSDFKGPDFFVVKGATREPIRPSWVVWEEDGRYPNVIVELLSPTTANVDLTEKKRVYEQIFRTPNYFCFDPATRELLGWNLEHNGYERLSKNEAGRLWSDELQLWLGPWDGEFGGYTNIWLRFFTPDGTVVPVPEEYQLEQTEQQRRRAEAEQQRAQAECVRAEAECVRAEAAEAEVARLKRLMVEKGFVP